MIITIVLKLNLRVNMRHVWGHSFIYIYIYIYTHTHTFLKYVNLTTINIKGKLDFFIFYSILSTINKRDTEIDFFILYITIKYSFVSIFFSILSYLSPLTLFFLSRIITKRYLIIQKILFIWSLKPFNRSLITCHPRTYLS